MAALQTSEIQNSKACRCQLAGVPVCIVSNISPKVYWHSTCKRRDWNYCKPCLSSAGDVFSSSRRLRPPPPLRPPLLPITPASKSFALFRYIHRDQQCLLKKRFWFFLMYWRYLYNMHGSKWHQMQLKDSSFWFESCRCKMRQWTHKVDIGKVKNAGLNGHVGVQDKSWASKKKIKGGSIQMCVCVNHKLQKISLQSVR